MRPRRDAAQGAGKRHDGVATPTAHDRLFAPPRQTTVSSGRFAETSARGTVIAISIETQPEMPDPSPGTTSPIGSYSVCHSSGLTLNSKLGLALREFDRFVQRVCELDAIGIAVEEVEAPSVFVLDDPKQRGHRSLHSTRVVRQTDVVPCVASRPMVTRAISVGTNASCPIVSRPDRQFCAVAGRALGRAHGW